MLTITLIGSGAATPSTQSKLALRNRLVEEPARDVARVGGVILDLARGEGRADDPAKASVSGAVRFDQGAASLERIWLEIPQVDVAIGRREDLRVLRHVHDVGMLRERPEAASLPVPCVPVNGIVLPQQAEALVGDADLVDLLTRDIDVLELSLGDAHSQTA